MLGLIRYEESRAKPSLMPRQILGGTFLTLEMGRYRRGGFADRNAACWARRMREQGIRSAVFSADFPHTSLFIRQGILPVDPIGLQRTLCASCVCRRLEELGINAGRAVVAVAARHMSREVEDTVHTFAMKYRYILLSVESGGEAFAREMMRKYGAALLLNPTDDQLNRSDALILFDPMPGLAMGNPVICAVYHGAVTKRGSMRLWLTDPYAEKVGTQYSQEQFAAALHSMGVLMPEMVKCEITC